ncbi:MAG TPA: hypothetical protein VNI84_02460 [Pyrinomonadaceae bacterium]|nr:hypothetical protein [Pyrinomonadaceae bacterium]
MKVAGATNEVEFFDLSIQVTAESINFTGCASSAWRLIEIKSVNQLPVTIDFTGEPVRGSVNKVGKSKWFGKSKKCVECSTCIAEESFTNFISNLPTLFRLEWWNC